MQTGYPGPIAGTDAMTELMTSVHAEVGLAFCAFSVTFIVYSSILLSDGVFIRWLKSSEKLDLGLVYVVGHYCLIKVNSESLLWSLLISYYHGNIILPCSPDKRRDLLYTLLDETLIL